MTKTPALIIQLVQHFYQSINLYRSGALNETETRIQFINPFFEALGWDMSNREQVPDLYKDVVHEDSLKIQDSRKAKAPDYSFRIGGVRKFFVEAKKPSVNVGTNINAAFQLRRYGWSANLSVSILTDFEEFAVYDCRIMPDKNDSASQARVKYFRYVDYEKKWDEIYGLFSKEAVLHGSLEQFAEKKIKTRITVDKAFLLEIERWRENLATNIAWRNPQIKQRELNFAVQMTINRMIFLRICEDRGIESYGQLLDLLKSNNLYQELERLFLKADYRYNSGLFHFQSEKGREEQDNFTLSLNIEDPPLIAIIRKLYPPESPYEFSVIPVEILGQVYEQFLGKVIRLSSRQAVVEDKPEVRKAGGVYYTPSYIVDYIVKHTIGRYLEEKKPEDIKDLSVLDPSCGSGSFLIVAYQFLLDWYLTEYLKNQKKYKKLIYQTMGGGYRLTSQEKKRILLAHVYGVDIDQQAVETSKLSLLLKVLEGESQETVTRQLTLFKERALPDLDHNIKCGNSLIASDYYENVQLNLLSEDEIYRVNVFDWESSFPNIIERGGFDVIIGNPPYIQSRDNLLSELDKNYFYLNFKTVDYQINTYSLFLEKSINFLRPNGYMGMIIPNYWLSTKSDQKLRRFLFLENSVIELVNVYKIFFDATVDTLILIAQRPEFPIFPKQSLIKSLDRSIKSISERLICVRDENWSYQNLLPVSSQDNDILVTFSQSFELKGRKKLNPLKDYFIFKFGMKAYEEGKGKPPQDRQMMNTKIYHSTYQIDNTFYPLLRARDLKRYCIKWEKSYIKYGENLAAPRDLAIFQGRRLILHRIISKTHIEGTYLEDTFICNTDIITLKPNWNKDSGLDCRFFLGIILSKTFAVYIKSKNINLDRAVFPKINTNTLENIPVPCLDLSQNFQRQQHDLMVQLVEQMLRLHQQINQENVPSSKKIIQQQIKVIDKQINQLVYELYELTDEIIALIEG